MDNEYFKYHKKHGLKEYPERKMLKGIICGQLIDKMHFLHPRILFTEFVEFDISF